MGVTKRPMLRAKGPNGSLFILGDPPNGVEVSGTCVRCKETVYFKAPPELAASFQDCNRVLCPKCFPGSGTKWYYR